MERQYDQYRMAEANTEAMHRIRHDLKHQLTALRMENNEERRAKALA